MEVKVDRDVEGTRSEERDRGPGVRRGTEERRTRSEEGDRGPRGPGVRRGQRRRGGPGVRRRTRSEEGDRGEEDQE